MTSTSSLPIGELPPLGEVPQTMHAQVVRQDRLGEPIAAFQVEEIPTPDPGPGEVLIAVMAAGVNYNNVWAARGEPQDVIAARQRAGDVADFHVGGSDASGIVYRLGPGVDNVSIGDEVVVHPGYWLPDDPWILAGKDAMLAPSARIWGYDTNYGSFAQFSICQSHQLMSKASRLTWEEAAAPSLVGTTAFRMLFGWDGHVVEPDDVVLVWGGSGGLGSQAIQLARWAGAIPVAVVSDDQRGRYCESLGAEGFINRAEFNHWGMPPHWSDTSAQREWSKGARAFGKALWEIIGSRRNPRIVFEHPGEATIPTSIFLCETGGMVVICAGTTGYSASVDLRYHWTRQKRLQGSHGTNDAQARAYNHLVEKGAIEPALGRTLGFGDVGRAHQEMGDGKEVFGNTVIRIGCSGAAASDPNRGDE